jgi:hypothetical protein
VRWEHRDYEKPEGSGEWAEHAKQPLEEPNLVRRGVPDREHGNYGEDGRGEQQEEEPQQRVPKQPQWGYQEVNVVRELCIGIHCVSS